MLSFPHTLAEVVHAFCSSLAVAAAAATAAVAAAAAAVNAFVAADVATAAVDAAVVVAVAAVAAAAVMMDGWMDLFHRLNGTHHYATQTLGPQCSSSWGEGRDASRNTG